MYPYIVIVVRPWSLESTRRLFEGIVPVPSFVAFALCSAGLGRVVLRVVKQEWMRYPSRTKNLYRKAKFALELDPTELSPVAAVFQISLSLPCHPFSPPSVSDFCFAHILRLHLF